MCYVVGNTVSCLTSVCYNIAMADVIPITMVRDTLTDLPRYPIPEGYSIRKFKGGEGPLWAEIGAAAGNFGDLAAAQERFNVEFSEPVEDMESRCFFVVHDETDRAVGTAMAWYDPNFDDGSGRSPSRPECDDGSGRSLSRPAYGRVHWVAIIPDFQGKRLAKPLLSAVLSRLAESHTKAVLGTQTFRKPAVRLYLDLGFRPFPKLPTCPQAWKELAEEFKHPALASYL